MIFRVFLFLGVATWLSAQAVPGQNTVTPTQAAPAQPGQGVSAVPQPVPEYFLQPGDTVDVRFFFNSELNEQAVQIRPDGRISLQLVGDVQFAGRTVEQVSRELEKAYASIVKTPRATIQIRGYAGQKAFISGEVPKPGTISLLAPATVLSAIGEAGGITIKGDRNRVVLIRKMPDGTPKGQQIVLFAKKQPTPAALTPLQPYDVVLVPESKIARVDRWVDQFMRQLSPANLVVGFNYLWQNNSGVVTTPIPF